MADEKKDQGQKKTLSLSSKKLEWKKTVDAGQIRQSFSHGRSKSVAFEVKKKRQIEQKGPELDRRLKPGAAAPDKAGLSQAEIEARIRLLKDAQKADEEAEKKRTQELQLLQEVDQKRAEVLAERHAAEQQQRDEERRKREEETARLEAEEQRRVAEEQQRLAAEAEAQKVTAAQVAEAKTTKEGGHQKAHPAPFLEGARIKTKKTEEEEESAASKAARKTLSLSTREAKQKLHSLSYEDALSEEAEEERQRSLASIKRARDKKKGQFQIQAGDDNKPIVRDVVIPETITVQELSNRMALRARDVIKKLMSLGVIATVNQVIDADTAELVVSEFGHSFTRVSESDVEEGLIPPEDPKELLEPRAPVVTVMGHVDHGKTSLLDSIRRTDVVASEAGGITQHIGAYQVTLKTGQKITFIDTPGHAAFSEMRSRGANVTDIVVLVVAADDGIKEQTIEAINHAKAARVPIIVAVNKIDKPDANPNRVHTELLSHELVVEQMGGDIQCVEVSAKQGLNIDKLEEAILLQAEILELAANPNHDAIGAVIEARIEKGRGAVATVLVQRGTLKVGDIFVVGTEYGRVRALMDDRGAPIKSAGPAVPVEVLGLSGAPAPGDTFIVVDSEARAKVVAEYRLRTEKTRKAALARKSSLDLLMQGSSDGKHKTLSVIIKSDVQGSAEAIIGSFDKIESPEVSIKVLHTGVGAINESDITLAQTTNAFVIGFNVRANPQARDLAAKEGIELRYYSIIYDVIDDIKKILSGLLTPEMKENFLGYAEIREVFNITKVGKVAGCMVTQGEVKRGAKVRLLRDNVVIHEGALKTLKRFKDEVKEVKEGYECGMAFENYNDIRPSDMIECFEVQEIARTIA
jgi:bacterial translation initiation factor 2 (bIF-2)